MERGCAVNERYQPGVRSCLCTPSAQRFTESLTESELICRPALNICSTNCILFWCGLDFVYILNYQ